MIRISELMIARAADGWQLVSQGRNWGRFAYRVDAEEAALRLAATARLQGQAVTVLVKDGGDRTRVLDQDNPRPL